MFTPHDQADSCNMASTTLSIPRESLLGIPAELRLQILSFALGQDASPTLVHLRLTGNAKGWSLKSNKARAALPLVCRLINEEVTPILPEISNTLFIFPGF